MTRFQLIQLIRQAALKPTAIAVGLEIAAHWNDETSQARIGAAEIGNRIGRKDRQVREAINELVEAGIIVKVKTKRASIYRAADAEKKMPLRVNAPAENRRSWDLDEKGLNPKWRQILPEFSHMTDDEVAAEFQSLTRAAQLADETGWSVQDIISTHPDWVQAQISTVRAEREERRGPTGSRFLEYCPLRESSESAGERYTKDQEFYLGF